MGTTSVDPVGHGGDQGDEEGRCRDLVCLLNELDKGELAGPVDGDKEIELALSGLHLSDVDVEEVDRVGFEPFLRRPVALDIRQAPDAMALQAAVQGRACQVWDGGLKGVEAVVSGSSVWRRKATTIASSAGDSTVDLASRGPVGRSLSVSRFRHLATVLGLIP